ncbi:RepB family plasmid replication initiator protein, partial [Klebsiella pneumoniae]|uniref:RepB family plasmid replication initiator protein n=2 Tax=Pseudomonadota TaxID=1224 RepID=UPI002549E9DB
IDHIKDPMTRYTPIELMYQNRLSTVSAIILYEHCLSFLKLGRTMNHQVDNLIMFLRAQESSKDQRKISYREFKNDYLKKAIAEINTQTNVTIK